jgi:hypothetical protein
VEIFYETPQETGGEHNLAFNAGAIINITENHHILMSAGTDIDGPASFFSYIAYQLTFGPEKQKAPRNSPPQMIDHIYATDEH